MATALYPVVCVTCRNEVEDPLHLAEHICTWSTGTCYLLHFDRPIGGRRPYGTAQHYTGSAIDLPARLAEHRAGNGARIMAEVARLGIGWTVARTWPGGRIRERQLKRQGGAARHCPLCRAVR